MALGSVCTRALVAIDCDASLQQVAQLMRERHVGAVILTRAGDAGSEVAGIVTDRDLAIEVLASGVDARGVAARALLDQRVLSLPEQAELDDAIDLMQSAGVRRLLVHDAEGRLVGLVSFDDILQACAAQLSGLAGVLGKGIEREAAQRGKLAAQSAPPLRVPAMGTAGWAQPGLGRVG